MDWRKLERHSISAEYRDISGPAFYRLKLKLQRHGILGGRKITLHEGKVLDGWQMYRACLDTDIEPEFAELPEGMDAREFVEVVNDERRHETPAEAAERKAARLKAAGEARVEGKSLRQIAEELEVSVSTVSRDLEQIEQEKQSGVPYGTPDLPETPPVVTGKDGKTYKTKVVLCRHCEHRMAVGKPLIGGCEECAKLRKIIKPKKEKVVEEEGPVVDDSGAVVPQRLIPVFKTLKDFEQAEKILNQCAKAFQKIEQGPTKGWKPAKGKTHYQLFYKTFGEARKRLKAMKPSLVCTICAGDGGCSFCFDGWMSHEACEG